MDAAFYNKLKFCLFLCRISVTILIVVWAFDKVVRPEHSVGIIHGYYHIPITAGLTMALGYFHFIIATVYLLGLFKEWVPAYVLAIVTVPLLTPKFWDGLGIALTTAPHPTILFFTTICTIAAAFLVYRLRDYDSWLSISERPAMTEEA